MALTFDDLIKSRSVWPPCSGLRHLSCGGAGREVSLTPTELRLLLVLSGSPRQVFSREQLLDLVWEHDYLGDSRLVDACVQRLRAYPPGCNTARNRC